MRIDCRWEIPVIIQMDGCFPDLLLSIVEYIGRSGGLYLLYLDETGKEQTDTFYDMLEQAFNQVAFEFNIKKSEWEKFAESNQ